MKQRPAIDRQRNWGKGALTTSWLGTTDPSKSDNLKATAVGGCVLVGVRACVRDVFAMYDNNIRPRLIMVIIKIIILYFIQNQ